MILMLAASVLLAWDPNPEPDIALYDIALYRLYVGIQPITAGNPPATGFSVDSEQFQIDRQFEVDGLDYGRKYFFRVTAINLDGLESGYSNEIQYTPVVPPEPLPEPTPGKWWKKD